MNEDVCAREKAALRRRYRALRDGLGRALREEGSRLIAGHVVVWDRCARAREVFLYRSMGSEVMTEGLLVRLIEQGKRVSLPRVAQGGAMEALRYRPGDALARGAHGALEPLPGAPVVGPGEIDLVLVPALALTRSGMRLGYGGGYYDRFLARTGAVSLALCFSQQVVDSLPSNRYDREVEYLATPEGIVHCREDG